MAEQESGQATKESLLGKEGRLHVEDDSDKGDAGEVGNWIVRMFGPSWKIRLAGLLTVLFQVAVLFSSELGISDSTALKLTNAIGLITGLGVMGARQNNVSSQQVLEAKKQ